ncbi:3-hydroxyphenylacetate 6-hydroxylase [Pseudocercospora fuligena]|uniref:3-hydroxyphenylacetate 6-hydroxylase n=1 Tax=Pseudocercospora fuligena TaxID=685502 RepID=A0A8H6RJ87_9PEZI|nr:3-hydroxyphenylacetate 6-hydroxylase [Pseudocercospora fuligena]
MMESTLPSLFSASIGAAILATFSTIFYLLFNEVFRYRKCNPHFAGPPGNIIFGHLRQLQVNAPEAFRWWSKQYGEVFQIQLGNVPILVVNSAAAAKELFAHHGHALNSRPVFYTFHKIVAKTAGFTIGTSPISPELKTRRRAAATALNKPAVVSYAGHLDLETRALVEDIFSAGGQGEEAINPMPLVKRFALSVILTLNWGRRITSDDQALFKEISEVEAGIVSTRSTLENLQDYIPLLRWNPFPARSQQARDWRRRRDVYLSRLDQELRDRIEAGSYKPCIQANAMLDPSAKLSQQDLHIISTSMIQGGTGTISGTISWALAFLSQHPEIQAKALAEINRHYQDASSLLSATTASAPEFRDHLPYLHALAQECLRYFAVLRLSLPRETTQDVVMHGDKVIPSGSVIFLNAWACNLDPTVHKDPEEFRPERWIEGPDLPLFTFGLGYRMCAGSALANRELELVLLRVLGCFEILPKKLGDAIDVSPWTGSANVVEGGRFPREYEVVFRPKDRDELEKALRECEI